MEGLISPLIDTHFSVRPDRRYTLTESDSLFKKVSIRYHCDVCGKMLAHTAKGGPTVYCGTHARGEREKLKLVHRTCKRCEKPFSMTPSRARTAPGLYCSKICARTSHNEQQAAKKPVFECYLCKKSFKRAPSRSKSELVFCSKRCAAVHNAPRPEDNPLYIDGRMGNRSLRVFLRHRREYLWWTRDVRKRDGQKCVDCGATEPLHAHHLHSFSQLISEFLDRHPDKDATKDKAELLKLAQNDSLLWDIANGVTLCGKCHQNRHPDLNLLARAGHANETAGV